MKFKYQNDDAGGQFGDQRGQTECQHASDEGRGDRAAAQTEPCMLAVEGQHDQTDARCQTGCQNGTENAHMTGKDEHIVQNNVGKTACKHGGHGKTGRTVIAHKANQNVVEQKGRREEQNDAQIGCGHGEHLRIGAEQGCERCGEE